MNEEKGFIYINGEYTGKCFVSQNDQGVYQIDYLDRAIVARYDDLIAFMLDNEIRIENENHELMTFGE